MQLNKYNFYGIFYKWFPDKRYWRCTIDDTSMFVLCKVIFFWVYKSTSEYFCGLTMQRYWCLCLWAYLCSSGVRAEDGAESSLSRGVPTTRQQQNSLYSVLVLVQISSSSDVCLATLWPVLCKVQQTMSRSRAFWIIYSTWADSTSGWDALVYRHG